MLVHRNKLTTSLNKSSARFLTYALMAIFLLVSGCMKKGSKSATDARSGGKFKATPSELKNFYAPNFTLEGPITFKITNIEGLPIPNVKTEFRVFEITAGHSAGLSDDALRNEMIAKWNDGNFMMNSKGVIDGAKCDAGFTRDACAGILSGASLTTNQNGDATVGFSTPNSPGAVLAVAVKVPENSNASDLVAFVKVRVATNEEFIDSGIAPIQSVLLVIPLLFDNDGNQVVRSGSTFNLAVYAPGVPNTLPGKGYSFDFTTDASADILNAEGTIVPKGSLNCEFKNSQCIVPGGPFRVMKPGPLTFAAKPSNPKFPVKPTSISIRSTIGDANKLVFSMTDATKGVNPVCSDGANQTQRCLILTSGEAALRLYPMLVDAGDNFVSYFDTNWQIQGSSTPLTLTKDETAWIISTNKAGDGVINVRRADGLSNDLSFLTYTVLPGPPARIDAVSSNTSEVFGSVEQATVDFNTRLTLLDVNGNVCTNFTGPLKIVLDLLNTQLAVPPESLFPSDQIPDSAKQIIVVDHSQTPVQMTQGIGRTTGFFRIERITQPSENVHIKVRSSELTLPSGAVTALAQTEPKSITVIPGPAKYSLLRTIEKGVGDAWNADKLLTLGAARGIALRTDIEYSFYNAGYDAAGNYTNDEVDSYFFGVDYRITPQNSTGFTSALTTLRSLTSTQLANLAKSGPGACDQPLPEANPVLQQKTETTVTAGSFVSGTIYKIASIGENGFDFTSVGAPANTIGVTFVATGPGDEDLTATAIRTDTTTVEQVPTNMPHGLIYCGIHRGLSKKEGRDTTFRSASIPGTGRLIAIPKNQLIAPNITNRMTLSSGTANKYSFEYRDPVTDAVISTADRSYINSADPEMRKLFNRPIPAGQKFKIHIIALDATDLIAVGHQGVKPFTIVSSSEVSWGGITYQIPNTQNTSPFCNFSEPGVPAGHCVLKKSASNEPQEYFFTDARAKSLISVEENQQGGLTGVYSDFIDVSAGEPRRLYFANRKGISLENGGPSSLASALTSMSSPIGTTIKVGVSAQPWAIAVADEWGNWLRDADMSKIDLTGFSSISNSTALIFDQREGIPIGPFEESELFNRVVSVQAGSFEPGKIYTIESIGTTNFITIGAESNALGTTFTATGPGSGTGTAKTLSPISKADVDAGQFIVGKRYVITEIGTTDFKLIGATDNQVGLAFTATGVGSGTGKANTEVEISSKKFFDPNDDTDLEEIKIHLGGTIDTDGDGTFSAEEIEAFRSLYQIVYVPQNRIGSGFASVKYKQEPTITSAGSFVVGETYEIFDVGSTDFKKIGASDNVNGIRFTASGVGEGSGKARTIDWISWPSPYLTVQAGAPEHVDIALTRGDGSNPTPINNRIEASTVCHTPRITIHDAKHNKLEFSGRIQAAFKLINGNGDQHPADPHALNFGFLESTAATPFYAPLNKALMVGPFPDSFDIGLSAQADYGGKLWGVNDQGFLPHSPVKDWWTGLVNINQGEISPFPGKICLFNGQDAAKYPETGIDKYLQVDLAPGGTFPGLTSRGEGIQYAGPGGVMVGSKLAGSQLMHQDRVKFRVVPGQLDHLHPSFTDGNPKTFDSVSHSVPQLNMAKGENTIGVTEICPAYHCGETHLYWHKHDEAHNYLGPASTDGFTQANLGGNIPHKVDNPVVTGATTGAPRTTVFPNSLEDPSNSRRLPATKDKKYVVWVNKWETHTSGQTLYQRPMYSTFAPGWSFLSGFNIPVIPGPPKILKVENISGMISTESNIHFYLSVFDEYDNPAGGGGFKKGGMNDFSSWFSIDRTLRVHWNKQGSTTLPPSNAPIAAAVNPATLHRPRLLNSTNSHFNYSTARTHNINKLSADESPLAFNTSTSGLSSQLVKSNEGIDVTFYITDNTPISWCTANPGQCTSELKATIPYLEAAPGSPTSLAITNGQGIGASTYSTDNYMEIFKIPGSSKEIYPMGPDPDRIINTYACGKDFFGNINTNSCFDETTFTLEDVNAPVGNGVFKAVSGDLEPTPLLRWYPQKPGSFKITASKLGFTTTSDPIVVGALPLHKFSIKNINPVRTDPITVDAGDIVQAEICMVDQADNIIRSPVAGGTGTITDPEADNIALNFSALGVPANPENRTIEISRLGGAQFQSLPLKTEHLFDFNAGCTNVFVKVLAKGNYTNDIIGVTYQDPFQNKGIFGQGLRVDTVNGLTLDHFVTIGERLAQVPILNAAEAWANPGSEIVYADTPITSGNRFDVVVYARDQYGNNVNVNNRAVSLSLRDVDKNISNRNPHCHPENQGCLNFTINGTDRKRIEGLALDIGGKGLYINAISGAVGISTEFSTLINTRSSLKTIKNYVVQAPTNTQIQPTLTSVTVTAVDAGGEPVIGIQDQLNNQDYTWLITNRGAGQYLANSDNNLCMAQFPKPQFVVSTATVTSMQFARSGSITLDIEDQQSTRIRSNNQTITNIASGDGMKFKITCQKSGIDCTGTEGSPYPILATPEDRFSLTVSSFDHCGNPKTSLPAASIKLEKYGSGTAELAGFLEHIDENFPLDGKDQIIVTRATQTSQSTTIDNLFHRSGNHSIKYSIDGSLIDMQGMLQQVYHIYSPDPGMIFDYRIQPLTGTDFSQLTVGIPVTFNLIALDIAGNTVLNLDNYLKQRTFVWSGFATKAPDNITLPTIPSATNLNFASGVAENLQAIFVKEENFVFNLVDQTLPGASGILGYGPDRKRILKFPPVAKVLQAAPETLKMEVTHTPNYSFGRISQIAGDQFGVKVTAFDKFGNLATKIGSKDLQFRWVGATSSTQPEDLWQTLGGLLSPKSLPDGSRTFDESTATFTTANSDFNLYKAGEMPTLQVTAPGVTNSQGSALSTSLQFEVSGVRTPSYVRVSNGSSYTVLGDLTNKPLSIVAGTEKMFYAHLFDRYGNESTNRQFIRWVPGGVLEMDGAGRGGIMPDQGSFTQADIVRMGTGDIEARCNEYVNAQSCVAAKTGPITVTPGHLARFVMKTVSPTTMAVSGPESTPTATAGQEIGLKLCMVDNRDNPITSDIDSNSQFTDADAELDIVISHVVTPNNETNSIQLSTKTGQEFNDGLLNIADTAAEKIKFENGCSNLYAKVLSARLYNGLALLSYKYTKSQTEIMAGNGLRPHQINPAPLHHYSTELARLANQPSNSVFAWSNPGTDTIYADNGGNRFDVWVEARDEFGNQTKTTGTASLTLRDSENNPIQGRNLLCKFGEAPTSCHSAQFNDQSRVRVEAVATDIGGKTLMVIADSSNVTTLPRHAAKFAAVATARTVKNYEVKTPTSAKAGDTFTVEVIARDNAGDIITSADNLPDGLNSQIFTWLDGADNNLDTHTMGGNGITAPTTKAEGLEFFSGRATVNLRLVKAEDNLKIKIKDSLNTGSINSGFINVSAGDEVVYKLSCKRQIGDADCSGSDSWHPFVASPSEDNQFKLIVSSEDVFGNTKVQVSASPEIKLTVDNPATSLAPIPGRLEQAPNAANTVAFGLSNQVIARMINTPSITIDKLFHRSGNHKISYSIDSSSAGLYNSALSTTVRHEYEPHRDMVYRYALTGISSPVIAGSNITSAKLTAFDIVGNVAKGVDNDLKLQNYTWMGVATTGITPATINMGTKDFVDGELTLTSLIFRKQESISALYVEDDYSQVVPGINTFMNSPKRQSTPISINVTSAKPTKYVLSGVPTSPQAGSPFSVEVTAVDEFGNTATTWPSDKLNIALTNNQTITNTATNESFDAARAPNDLTTKLFSNGKRSLGESNFALYNSNPTTLGNRRTYSLKVTGTVSAGTANNTALVSDTILMTLNPSTPSYVRVANSATYSTASDVTGQILNIDTTTRPTFFSHVFDQYGNYLGNLDSSWAATGQNITISSSSGVSTQLTTATTANGSITATCTQDAACNGLSATVDVNIGTSPLSHFSIEYADQAFNTSSGPVLTAGGPVEIRMCMRDSSNNIITQNVGTITNPNTTLSLTLTRRVDPIVINRYGLSMILTKTLTSDPANDIGNAPSITFSNGCSTLYMTIFNKTASTPNPTDFLVTAFYRDNNQNKELGGSGLKVSSVLPKPIHHYSIDLLNTAVDQFTLKIPGWSNPFVTSAVKANAGGNRFDVLLTARDDFGNVVTGNNQQIELKLLNGNSTPAAFSSPSGGRTFKCLTAGDDTCRFGVISSSQSSVTISNLAIDFGGQFINVKAEDAAGISSGHARLFAEASNQTVKDYQIIAPASVFASVSNIIKVIARDNYDEKILAADASLNSGTWTWKDSLSTTAETINMLNHTAGGNSPSLPNPNFSSGEASVPILLTKAETVKLALDNSLTLKPSVNGNNTTVFAGNEIEYRITCLTQTSNQDCSGTSEANPYPLAASQSTGLFKLKVQAFDTFGNPRTGNLVEIALAKKADNTLNTWRLESTGSVDRNPTNNLIRVNVNSVDGVTVENLYYHVAQPIAYSVASPAVTNQSTYHSYSPHLDMIKDYAISGFTNVTAGAQTSFRLQARDPAGNNALNLGGTPGANGKLSGQTFLYPILGTGSSTPPPSSAPTAPTIHQPSFDDNGLSEEISVTFRKRETINFIARDDRNRSGSTSVAVQSAKPDRYSITPPSTAPVAGTPFNVIVTALDQFGNAVAGWTDALNFTWSNASTVGTNTPGRFIGTSDSWTNGSFTPSTNSFVLYRSHISKNLAAENEKPMLSVTGTKTGLDNTLSGNQLSGSITLAAVQPNSLSYVQVTGRVTYEPSEVLTNPGTIFADNSPSYFAFGFDVYGNYIGPQDVTWSGTQQLEGRFKAPLTANNVVLEPTVPGVGNIVASCGSGCTIYTSGQFTISSGNASQTAFLKPLTTVNANALVAGRQYTILNVGNTVWTNLGASSNTQGVVFTANSNLGSGSGTATTNSFDITSEQCIEVEVQIRDRANNPTPAKDTDIPVTFTSTGGDGQFFANADECQAAINNANPPRAESNYSNFTAGSTLTAGTADSILGRVATIPRFSNKISVWYANRTVSDRGVTIKASPVAVNGSSVTLNTVNPGVPRRVSITSAAPDISVRGATANDCAAISYSFRDRWDNASPLTSSARIRLGTTSSTGVFYTNASCSAGNDLSTSSPQKDISVITGSVANDTIYYADPQANQSVLSILGFDNSDNPRTRLAFDGSDYINPLIVTKSVTATVRPGPFGFISASNVRRNYPFNIDWSPSLGAKDYALFYMTGGDQNCSNATMQVPGAVSIIDASQRATFNNTTGTLVDGTYTLCLRANGYTGSTARAGQGQTASSTKSDATPAYAAQINVIIDNGTPQLTSASILTTTPGKSRQPVARFTLSEPASVVLYSDNTCTADKAISSSTPFSEGNLTAQQITTNVLDLNYDGQIHAIATDIANNASTCTLIGSYRQDSSAPTISNTTMTQYSNLAGVSVTFDLNENSKIYLHTNDTCSSLISNTSPNNTASGNAANSSARTVTGSLASTGTYNIYIRAIDDALNESSCILVGSRTYDTNSPGVNFVDISNPMDGTYTNGNVDIIVKFNEVVRVTNNPQLKLRINNTEKLVNYTSGDNTDTLTFRYAIASGDNSTRLDYFDASSVVLPSTPSQAAIKDLSDNSFVAANALPMPGTANSLGQRRNYVIDTQAPRIDFAQTVSIAGKTLATNNSIIRSNVAQPTFNFKLDEVTKSDTPSQLYVGSNCSGTAITDNFSVTNINTAVSVIANASAFTANPSVAQDIQIKTTDPHGNTACTKLGSYFYDTNSSTPTGTSQVGTGTAFKNLSTTKATRINLAKPSFKVTFSEPTVANGAQIWRGLDCNTANGSEAISSTFNGTTAEQTINMTAVVNNFTQNSAVNVSVSATDEAGNTSCTLLGSYVNDTESAQVSGTPTIGTAADTFRDLSVGTTIRRKIAAPTVKITFNEPTGLNQARLFSNSNCSTSISATFTGGTTNSDVSITPDFAANTNTEIYVSTTDEANNQSTCIQLGSYHYDTREPIVVWTDTVSINNVVLASSAATIRSTVASPVVRFKLDEVTKTGTPAQLFRNDTCASGNEISATFNVTNIATENAIATNWAFPQNSANSTGIYIKTTDELDNSACRQIGSYVYDTQAPTPTAGTVMIGDTGAYKNLTDTTTTRANRAKPKIQFDLTEATAVSGGMLYQGENCTTSANQISNAFLGNVGTNTISVKSDFSFTANTSTSIRLWTQDAAGNTSCTLLGTYIHDTSPASIVGNVSIGSGSTFNTLSGTTVRRNVSAPTIKITLDEDVVSSGTRFFKGVTATCSAADAISAEFSATSATEKSVAITAGSLTANSNTKIFLKSTDDAGNQSSCTEIGTYHFDNLAPAISSGSTTTIGGVTLASGSVSRRNNANPNVALTLDQDTISGGVQLWRDGTACSTDNGATAISATTTFTGTNSIIIPITTAFTANATTASTIRLSTEDAAGNKGCIDLGQYRHDNIKPTVSSVTVDSIVTDARYKSGGSAIPIKVTFTEPVTINGTPKIGLNVVTSPATFASNYTSGDGTDTLTFNYTIAGDHASNDLDYVDTQSLQLVATDDILDFAGNSIKVNTDDAFAALPVPGSTNSIGGSRNIIIDNTAPTISWVSTNPVSPGNNPTPTITVSTSEAGTGLRLFSDSSCNTGISTATGSIESGNRVITLATRSNGSNTSLYALMTDSAREVGNANPGNSSGCSDLGQSYVYDASAPEITDSTLPTDNVIKNAAFKLSPTVTDPRAITYLWQQTTGAGDNTNGCTVQFAADSTFTGASSTSTLQDPWMRVINCSNGTVTGFGKVRISITATDAASNSTTRSRTIQWDAERPKIDSITVSSTKTNSLSAVHYKAGDTITFDVSFVKTAGNPTSSFALNVTGTPRIQLNTLGYATYLSKPSDQTLRFTYTVDSNDFNSSQLGEKVALASGASIDLNGGSIQDNVDTKNNASLTGFPSTALTSIKSSGTDVVIDTKAPTAVIWSSINIGSPNKDPDPTVRACTSAGTGATCGTPVARDVARVNYNYIAGSESNCNTANYSLNKPSSIDQTKTEIIDITANISSLPDGAVSLCAKGVDLAGNEQLDPTTYEWVKDTTPPVAITNLDTYLVDQAKKQFELGQTVSFKWTNKPLSTGAGDPADPDDIYKVNVFMSRTAGCSGASMLSGTVRLDAPATSSYSYSIPTNTVDGLIYYCVLSEDYAGNVQAGLQAASTSYEVESDVLHVSWTDSTGVRYANKNKNSTWSAHTVASSATGTFGSRTSLALNSTNAPAISYQFIDGANSSMRFRTSTLSGLTPTWGTQRTPSSSTDSNVLAGAFNDISISGSSAPINVFFGLDGDGIADLLYTIADNTNLGTRLFLQSAVRDVSTITPASNYRYSVVTTSSGLQVIDLQASEIATLNMPSGCVDAAYSNAMASSLTQIGVATACVMADNSCQVHFSSFTYNSAGITASWTPIGTILNASCSLNALTEGDRPAIVLDRIKNEWSIAWTNRSASPNQLMRWSQEIPTSINANRTEVVTSGTSIGEQTMAVDATGKTYIIYKAGDSIKVINNNARPDSAKIGGWNTFLPSTNGQDEIVNGSTVTGIGSMGISGMRGRSTVGQ